MSMQGLSLVGFMDRESALRDFRRDRVCANANNDAGLAAEWDSARERLDIQPIPPAQQTYLEQLVELDAARPAPNRALSGVALMPVELAPLPANVVPKVAIRLQLSWRRAPAAEVLN